MIFAWLLISTIKGFVSESLPSFLAESQRDSTLTNRLIRVLYTVPSNGRAQWPWVCLPLLLIFLLLLYIHLNDCLIWPPLHCTKNQKWEFPRAQCLIYNGGFHFRGFSLYALLFFYESILTSLLSCEVPLSYFFFVLFFLAGSCEVLLTPSLLFV